jgi:squalene-hopene/tetraprenyl-beta-curcumene cyclase
MSRKCLILAAGLAVAAGIAGCSNRQGARAPAQKGRARPGAEPSSKLPAAKTPLSLPPAATEALDAKHLAGAQKLLNGGLTYLLSVREADGGWSLGRGANKPAITAMVLKALLRHPDFDRTSPVVQKGFEVLMSYRQKDGGFYDPKQGLSSYTTAIAVMAMVAAQDPQYQATIRGASRYLQGLQIVPGQESPDGGTVAPDSPRIGGVGYGKSGEPNLSVLGMVVDAWHDAGMKPDHEAMERARRFLRHVQNRSESNPLGWAKEGADDGGFTYDLKHSKAGEAGGGQGMRSYGTMTYVGFKSMLYAGVARDDPRVRAAYDWIRRYWRLDSNPNMPRVRSKQGLFYYYHVFAKALRAWGQDEIPDLKKVKHNWRHELADALAERVAPDGSWVNKEASRWEEGNPVLATCYAVLALAEVLEK